MKANGSKKALVLAKRDQIMESLKEKKAQLESICTDGPQSDDDIEFIKTCLAFVLGEVCIAQAEAEDRL